MDDRPTGDWSDGYVLDTPYEEYIFPELCPARFSMASVLHGQPPLDRNRPLVWIELGCGNGLTACMVAAANPDVMVWGCDFNPRHVERARQLARGAGLTNCTFDEATFEDVAANSRLGPQEADVVVAHGVYSWISPRHQRQLIEIIGRRLAPGGLAYLSYGMATGWAAMVPLAEVMRLHADLDVRRSDMAFVDAAAAVRRLADGGARFFPIGPRETSTVAALADSDSRYAPHEYFAQHFRPVMFDEVAEAMSAARCSYVGSIEMADHMPQLWGPSALEELLQSTTDATLRQLLRDLIVERSLRRDLFRRGLATPNAVEGEDWIRSLRVVGLGKPIGAEMTVELPGRSVTLDVPYYQPLVAALSDRSIGVEDIQGVHPESSIADAAAALSLLVDGGFAAPELAGWRDLPGRATARRLNELLIAENRSGGDHRLLIAPAIGAAIHSEYVEMLTVGAIWDGIETDADTLADYVIDELQRQRRNVREQGASVTDPVEARKIVIRRVGQALERSSGLFARLGIC